MPLYNQSAGRGQVIEMVGDVLKCDSNFNLVIPVSQDISQMSKLCNAVLNHLPGLLERYMSLKETERAVGTTHMYENSTGRCFYFVVTSTFCQGSLDFGELKQAFGSLVEKCIIDDVTNLAMPRVGGRQWRPQVFDILKSFITGTKLKVTVFHFNK